MHFIWVIIKILVFTGILTVICKWSYNIIFMALKKPSLWSFLMLIINFLFFLVGSKIQNSFNAVWWSSALTFFAILPPQKNKENKAEINSTVDAMYEAMGIKKGRLKYRIGLAMFIIGGLAGWLIFYGEIITVK